MDLKIDSFFYSFQQLTMARQVFESIDLVRHIYSFDTRHRPLMARVLESLKNPTAQDLRIDRIFIPPHIDSMDVIQYFKDCWCRCCSRHSHRKTRPLIYNFVLCFVPAFSSRVPEDQNMDDCVCLCRQRSRVLVKRMLAYE